MLLGSGADVKEVGDAGLCDGGLKVDLQLEAVLNPLVWKIEEVESLQK